MLHPYPNTSVAPPARAAKWGNLFTLGLSALLAWPAQGQAVDPTFSAMSAGRPLVQTASGAVRGTQFDAQQTEAFLGIPFAQPPVQAQRFQAPLPAQPWTPSVLDATRFKPACVQQGKVPAQIGMSEDCLYLNVYRPTAQTADIAGRPVMVFLHGGRYWTGRSSENAVEKLALRGDVIVVTPAYRLNAFGFLADTAQARDGHANAGLQDQQMALRWVADNIRAFGGDPSRVTLFGESAGAGSVLMHLLADRSAGLFQRAILQSTWQWRLPTLEEAGRATNALAQAHGCAGTGAAALDCLREVPADKLLPNLAHSHAFQPVVDARMLKGQPLELLRTGRFHRNVTVTIGLNATEGHFMAMSRSGWKTPTDTVDDATFEKAAQEALHPFYPPQQVQDMLSWYAPVRAQQGNWQALSRLLGDFYLYCGSYDAAQSFLRHSRHPVFSYWFQHVSANHPKPFLGATHGDELDLLFGAPVYPPGYPLTAQDQSLSHRMMSSWAAFARSANPADAAGSGSHGNWKPMTVTNPAAYVWGEPAIPTTHPFIDTHGACARWQDFL